MQNPCPCGGFLYSSCCAPLHRGECQAATAEQLMRSRYSAYALGEVEYLLQTQLSPVPLVRRRRELAATDHHGYGRRPARSQRHSDL